MTYRYSLTRSVAGVLTFQPSRRLCWVMLNPSTADDATDDPTIRRVVRFTRDAGYCELEVINLFAARATNPRALLDMADPVGPDNDAAHRAALAHADGLVYAWGASTPRQLDGLAGRVAGDLTVYAAQHGLRPKCLGVTKSGHPRHPLYVKAAQPLVDAFRAYREVTG